MGWVSGGNFILVELGLLSTWGCVSMGLDSGGWLGRGEGSMRCAGYLTWVPMDIAALNPPSEIGVVVQNDERLAMGTNVCLASLVRAPLATNRIVADAAVAEPLSGSGSARHNGHGSGSLALWVE